MRFQLGAGDEENGHQGDQKTASCRLKQTPPTHTVRPRAQGDFLGLTHRKNKAWAYRLAAASPSGATDRRSNIAWL